MIPDILRLLRDEEKFDYCVDLTAVHYPKREKAFDLVWILYSHTNNERMRVKTEIAESEMPPSSVSIWPTANWLEREVFDMFGIQFAGHPDMKRICLPDGWKGHPLRKDYGIIQQDNEWVQINLGIEAANDRSDHDNVPEPRSRRKQNISRFERTHHQHGSATSGNPWCPPRHPQARRRKSSRYRVRDRISPSRRRKDCREPHLHHVQSLRGSHGLRGGGFEWLGILRSR